MKLLIEIIIGLAVVGFIGVGANHYVVDFRADARKAAATNFVKYLKNSVNSKKTQMALRCGTQITAWPRLQGILQNDVTEGGNPHADCQRDQMPEPDDRKFLGNANQPLAVPPNPVNGLATFAECACTDPCDKNCYSQAGFCYNKENGMIWGEGLVNNCNDRTLASPTHAAIAK